MLTTIYLKIVSVLVLWSCIVSSIDALADQPPAWVQKHAQLKRQSEDIFTQLENIYEILIFRVSKEDPTLLNKLSLDPPQARDTGYGLLPLLKENEPSRSVEPTQTFYSLKWLEDRLYAELEIVRELYDQLSGSTVLEELVVRFEKSLKRLRNLENNLSYQAKWQKAVVQYPAYFRNKNELVSMARELSSLIAKGKSPSQVADLRRQLLARAAPFRPTRDLEISITETGEMILPVTVCTDIKDSEFLKTFKNGVTEYFNLSPAALAKQFSIELNWQMINPGNLYPEGVPGRGTDIDMKAHYALFTGCPLVLTTGAISLNAAVGSRIFLGTGPVSPRTLAHEFGHLLGFEDAYVRGYDGDPSDPYGVVIVEWTGLSSDLMGDSDRGEVSQEMIDTLITTYGDHFSTHR